MTDNEGFIQKYFTNRRLRHEEDKKMLKSIKESKCEEYFQINLKGLGFGTLTAVGAAAATKVGLLGVGFGSLGQTAGSFAAAFQAATTASGSWFALGQSMGAIGVQSMLWPAAISGGAVYVGYTGVKYYQKRKCEKLFKEYKDKGYLSRLKNYWPE